MSTYKLELTETELACGVTLEAVAEILPKVLVREDYVMLPASTKGPALAGAVARAAFGAPAQYSHSWAGNPVYTLAR